MIMERFMKKLVGELIKFFKYKPKKNWQDIEYFNPDWKGRIENMSKFVTKGSTLVDLGCGKMWLKEFVTKEEVYIPVDYIKRSNDTIVCDFNKHQYPKVNADTAFISGCLEYILDYKWFVAKLGANHKKCILSYCLIENFPDKSQRIKKTWVNHLNETQICNLFKKNGFKLVNKVSSSNTIFVFEK